MPIELPLWLQNPDYAARLDRQLIGAIFNEGVIDGLAVTERAAGSGGPNLSVDVASGRAVIKGDDQANQGSYLFVNTTVMNVTGFSAAPAAGQERYSLVCARVNDPNAAGPAGDNGTFVVVNGVAAAVGSAAIPAVPLTAIPLALVRMISTTVTITNSIITDMRPGASSVVGDPIGTIIDYSGPSSALDDRYVVADGQEISRTFYSQYFALVGTTYGAGNGTTTFNVPDLRGRFTMMLDGTANRVTGGDTLGATGGTSTKTISTPELPPHLHSVPAHNHTGASGSTDVGHTHTITHTHPMSHTHTATTTSAGAHTHTTNSAGGHVHDNAQGGNGYIQHAPNGGSTLDLFDGGTPYGHQVLMAVMETAGTHTHTTVSAGAHTHPVTVTTFGGYTGAAEPAVTGTIALPHTHTIPTQAAFNTTSVGGGGPFDIMPPFIALVKAIKVL